MITTEQLNDKTIQDYIKKYSKYCTLLRPHKSSKELDKWTSKFGGIPNLNGHKNYPCCPSCQTALNYTFQIFKKDFPEFYFPDNKVLFQVFRCPNGDCPNSFNEFHDLSTYHYYFSEDEILTDKSFDKPITNTETYEDELRECILKPQKVDDLPGWGDSDFKDIELIQKRFGEDWTNDEFLLEFSAKSGSKINGYPVWIQGAEEIKCKCGNIKTHFFQLSSEDVEEGVEYPPHHDNWSGHGLMIGDLGFIYFFYCKNCGLESIETRWECS